MRFLRLFSLLFFGVLFLVGGGYFLVREGTLLWGARQVTNDVRYLMTTNQWRSMVGQCYQEGQDSLVQQLQLRFLDDTRYVLELRCGNNQSIEMLQKSLPLSVTKTTGTAGFIYDLQDLTLSGAITLRFMDQTRVLEARTDHIATYWGATTIVSDELVSSCEAHGFQCCDATLEQGAGDVFRTGVNDCQEQCYSSCRRRPNLILFETDPLLKDDVVRRVEISRSVPSVFFQYAFSEGESPLQEVQIEYGDGTREVSSAARGEFIKEYSCNQEECSFRVQIQAIDQMGIKSSLTRISQVEVVLLAD